MFMPGWLIRNTKLMTPAGLGVASAGTVGALHTGVVCELQLVGRASL